MLEEEKTEEAKRGAFDDVDPTDVEEAYKNMIIFFGCAPGSGVDARSTIAVEFFR